MTTKRKNEQNPFMLTEAIKRRPRMVTESGEGEVNGQWTISSIPPPFFLKVRAPSRQKVLIQCSKTVQAKDNDSCGYYIVGV